MKIVILRENLKNALSVVGSAVGGAQLPVLKNILAVAKNGELLFSSTNLDLGIVCSVPAKIEREGAVAIPYALFSSLVGGMSHEKVVLEVKERSLVVVTDAAEAVIQIGDEKEFPIIPDISQPSTSARIKGGLLKEALEQVIGAAASTSDFRPALAGVYFDFQAETLSCVATDSFRLAEKKINTSYVLKSEKGTHCIVPARNVQEIVKVLPDQEITVTVDEHQFSFSSDTVRLVSRIIDAKYPDYKAIIPTKYDCVITAATAEIFEGLRLSSAFAGKQRDVKIVISENKKTMSLLSKDAGVGESVYRVPIKCEGEPIETVFNVSYVVDGMRAALRTGKEERVNLSLNQGNRPSCITTPGDQTYSYILMPIKHA